MKKVFKSKIIFIVLVTVGLLISITACGGGSPNLQTGENQSQGNQDQTANIVVNDAQGEIKIDGSSTMFPMCENIGKEFNKSYPNVKIQGGVSGTTSGFRKFIRGKIDICAASSPMTEVQKQDAADQGIQFIELVAARDGILVVVNKENNYLNSITVDELKKIWAADSTAAKWKDVNPKWADADLKLFAPTGEAEFFSGAINGDPDNLRPDFNPSDDGNSLIASVAGDKDAMGIISYEDYLNNKDKVKVLGIDSGAGVVNPEESTIKDMRYKPLGRQLYLYVNKKSMDNEFVKKYLEFFLGDGAKLIKSSGSIPLDDYKAEAAKLN